MRSITSLRSRISRFLDDRYYQREQPHYFWDLLIFAVLALLTLWPVLPVAHAIMRLP